MPPLNERQLPTFRESLGKWASDIFHKRKPSGLAFDLSRAHQISTSEPIDDRSLYVDLANFRGLSAGTFNLGGAVVGTDVDEISQAFFPVSAITQAGAVFEMHQSNLAVPRQVTTETASWLAEADQCTESSITLGQAVATPKRASVLLTYTRQLNVQSDVGAFVQSNGLKALGAAVDRACLSWEWHSRGARWPVKYGIRRFDCHVQRNRTLANMATYVFNCESANVATEDISFIGAPNVKQKLQTVQEFSGSSTALWDRDSRILGRPAMTTTNITTARS